MIFISLLQNTKLIIGSTLFPADVLFYILATDCFRQFVKIYLTLTSKDVAGIYSYVCS